MLSRGRSAGPAPLPPTKAAACNQRVIRTTVGRFLQEVDYQSLPEERHILPTGKFPRVGQARKDPLVPRAAASAARK
jgi:hypothetical protein